jgi:hypothetical protein
MIRRRPPLLHYLVAAGFYVGTAAVAWYVGHLALTLVMGVL